MARVWWARHGQSEANVTQTLAHRRYDPGLTQLGRRQTAGLAERLTGVGVARVFCSPLVRARETASVVTERLGLAAPQVLEGLCELDVGSLDGRSDAAAWQTYHDVQAAWAAGVVETAFPEGEDRVALLARLSAALGTVAAVAVTSPGAVLVVAHGGNLQAALPGWGVTVPDRDLGNAGLVELDLTSTPDGVLAVRLISWAS
jgi:probable phosphoglycerate mutase